jgi:phage repressor protein C with HTH and peptisase S24 domain
MENSVKERLNFFLKKNKIKGIDFCTKINVSKGYISGIRESIQPDKLKSIAINYPKLNIGWLMTGIGDMLKEDVPPNNTYIKPEKTSKPFSVPLIPIDAVAGFSGEDVPSVRFEDCERYAVPEFEKSGCEFVIRVSGSSMYPKYSNGDILACKKVMDILFFQWGKIYVVDSSQGALVKRIYEDKEDADKVVLVSENKDKYPPFSIPKGDIRSLSIVLGVIRME